MVMETGVPAKKDFLLFVHIGIQSNRLPEILEVSVMHFSKQFHVSNGGTSGGNICKTPNKMLLFCCTHCFVGVNNISQNAKKKKEKKSFLYCRSLQLEMNENHHNMFISHSFWCLKTKRRDDRTSVRSVSCLKETVA